MRWKRQFGQKGGGDPESGPPPDSQRTLELLVIEGPDAGSVFTVDGREMTIGRGATQKGRTGVVCLRDPTISPQQASIAVGDTEVVIEHRNGATNATLLNGEVIERSPIEVGDRIQMGHTVFEVRSRPGISLSGLLAIPKEARIHAEPTARPVAAATTEVRTALPRPAELTLLRGIREFEGQRFPLSGGTNRLGRHPSNDIVLPEQGVSRYHAELVWQGEQLFLVHKSATNPSFVDGERIDGRVPLSGGQIVQLADRVALRIDFPELPPASGSPADSTEVHPVVGAGSATQDPAPVPDAPPPPPPEASTDDAEPSLRDLMEEKVRRDAEIERDYGFHGSFLDLDVVDSHGMKVQASRPEHIIVSFERFRAFAQSVVEEHKGQVLNSNGDELMCFFDEPLQAVRGAAAVLDRLREFNERQNLLERPFRVRQGIHTGRSLLDRERGVAYSPVLDVAGHLQKYAPENGLLVSDETLQELPDDLPFASVGELGKEKVTAHRLSRPED